jgi:hypothetical protein
MQGREIVGKDLGLPYLGIWKNARMQMQFFGIDPLTYEHIAKMTNHPMNRTAQDVEWPASVPRLHIVKVLRKLARTGEVDWN